MKHVATNTRPTAGLCRFACALGILLNASTPALAQAQPATGGTLTFAVESEPANYDCHANVSYSFLHAVAPSYSTLLKFDAANYPQIKGDLAESWSVSPDRLTYRFRLQANVLFHDGAALTSSDVKASYERILHPPPGVISARQSDYAAISAIETPDPLTVVFHLQHPDAAMLANFASPWNCIYQSAKLVADPQFPRTHVLGTGPFVFVEHKKGQSWTGRRWEHYFQPGKPYLDGYEADFMSGASVVKSMEAGQVMAGFRSFTPAERDELRTTLGGRVSVQESPWLFNLMLVFNPGQAPFNDARVRRALSLAIDRWGMAETLSHSTAMKFVGGVMRPGSAMATPEATLAALPGFSHDIAASREEARRLLAEAGVHDLKIELVSRDLPPAYGPNADAVIEAWRAIGVTANEVALSARDWRTALESGHFGVAFDFAGGSFDDPSQQLGKYVSRSLVPSNFANWSDPELDRLYIGQSISTDPLKRAGIVREFEERALTEARSVPILWWNRIVVTTSNVRGWKMTPSIYIGQDLADVWIDRPTLGSRASAALNADSRTARNGPATPLPLIALVGPRQRLPAGAAAAQDMRMWCHAARVPATEKLCRHTAAGTWIERPSTGSRSERPAA
jgi:peptide/nickel transport system substrate-binding protein